MEAFHVTLSLGIVGKINLLNKEQSKNPKQSLRCCAAEETRLDKSLETPEQKNLQERMRKETTTPIHVGVKAGRGCSARTEKSELDRKDGRYVTIVIRL